MRTGAKYYLLKAFKVSGGLVLVLLVYFFLFEHEKSLSVLETQDYELVTFSDESAGGNSKVISVKGDSKHITFKYQIGDQNIKYAGFNLVLNDSLMTLMSKYNQIKLKVSVVNLNAINLVAKTWEEGVTLPDVERSLRVNHVLIKGLKEGETSSVTFNLKEFATKDWWVNEFLGGEQIDISPDWTKVKQLSVLRASEIDPSKPSLISVKALSLQKEHTMFYLFGALLTSLIWFFFLVQIIREKYRGKVEITYKPIEVYENAKEISLEERVLWYLANEYSNPALKLESIAHEFAVGERMISSIIHNKFRISFKQYLNSIRINEGKKLLKQSDLSIKEITYKVGYSSPNNFRRVFKKNVGASPSDYRQEIR